MYYITKYNVNLYRLHTYIVVNSHKIINTENESFHNEKDGLLDKRRKS